MREFRRIVRDIRALRIQGAQAVSKSAVLGLKDVLITSKSKTANTLLRELIVARNKLVGTRPTEPCMRNALHYVFDDLSYSDVRSFRMAMLSKMQEALSHLRGVNRKVAEIGALKISNGMTVFTHCHSSTVVKVLLEAKKNGRRFAVHNTETRPVLQGRKTATELARAGIKVRHFVDSAARLALKKVDLMLIGADAITSEGKVVNKIGSELFAEVANRFGIPVFVCTDSWKFDPESVFGFVEPIEERSANEVWKGAPKGVTVDNHAFEVIASEMVTGVISEVGVYKPEVMVEVLEDEYPWMFSVRK